MTSLKFLCQRLLTGEINQRAQAMMATYEQVPTDNEVALAVAGGAPTGGNSTGARRAAAGAGEGRQRGLRLVRLSGSCRPLGLARLATAEQEPTLARPERGHAPPFAPHHLVCVEKFTLPYLTVPALRKRSGSA